MLPDVEGEGNECSESPIFIFFIKENWICVMIRHHADQTLIHYWEEIFLFTLVLDSAAILNIALFVG